MPMETSGHGVIALVGKAAESAPTENQGKQSPVPVDQSVHLSERVRPLQTISRALAGMPRVRAERVRIVQDKLASGRYRLDSKHLAALILEAMEDGQQSYRAAA